MELFMDPTGFVDTLAPIAGGRFTLKELQILVGGDIEVFTFDNGSELVINEDGKGLELEPNLTATSFARLGHRGFAEWDDYIVGPALLITDPKEMLE